MTLDTLRAQRDAARDEIIEVDIRPHYSEDRSTTAAIRDLDTLLALHAQVITLENAETLAKEAKTWRRNKALWMPDDIIAFLRATVEGA